MHASGKPTENLKADVDKLYLITKALWEILKEHHGYDDVELFKRVTEIDLRDGRADGRIAGQGAPKCPHCGRAMIGSTPLCLYCGKPSVRDPFER